MYFVRVCSRPKADLKHGYSYAMGRRGDPEAREPGLSGYIVDLPREGVAGTREEAIEEAVEALDERMCVIAQSGHDYSHGWFLAVYRGRHVGVGCDREDCFAPIELIGAFRIRDIPSLSDAIAKVASVIP